MHDDSPHLLLAYDDGPAGAVPRRAHDSLVGEHGPQQLPDLLWSDNDDIDDLALQRWCVVVPEGDRGERLRALVEPLAARRAAEQRAAVRTYPVPSRMSQGAAQTWLARLRAEFPRAREAPRYFLLLGDLDEVPLAVQQALALADACPGRLAFDRDDDYAAYVSRAMSEAPAEPRPAIASFAAGADPAIQHARARLLAPVHEQLRQARELGELRADVVELAALTADAPARPFLFTVSHGYGGDRQRGFESAARRRAEQGALVLDGGVHLGAADLVERPFAQDGFWFMFACYGAGTPEASAYGPWLRELRGGAHAAVADAIERALPEAGEPPFVAAVPRAALANPRGPLACFGHVDVAWQFSYSDSDPLVPSRPGKFATLVEDACRGRRAGAIARNLGRAAADAAVRLAAEVEESRRDATPQPRRRDRIAQLWLVHHDLAAFILLGDPAVRLRSPAAPLAAPPPAPTGTRPDVAPDLAALARNLGAARLEEALAQALVQEPARKVASRLGIELADLRALEDAYRRAGRRALGLDE